ncbi:MAG TPA: tetratricopeptide repeat protein, partial [Polyangiaceae bacterium]
MDSQTIRAALGKLQADPDSAEDWEALRAAAQDKEGKLSSESLIRLLEAARERHAERGEWEAVAQLLDVEAKATAGTPGEAELLMEQARVASEQLFDEEAASVLYYQLLELRPEHPEATAALDEAEGKRGRYEELCATYLEEAKSAPDDVYASSMLMRAAEMELRFAADALDLESVTERLEQAVRLDPTNERAGRMLERIYRRQSRWEEVARALERVADRSEEVGARVGAGVRLARLYAQKLEDNGRAAGAHARVLRDAPDNTEAMEFLSEFYSNEERWDELVALYEHELNRQGQPTAEQLGDMLQIAMLHWRKREKPEDAEPWFERVRKLHPDHEGMVTFYREYSVKTGDEALLLDVLQGAQRAIKDPEKKKELSREIAQLAEGQENAHKAIEQYKSMLRHNPDDESARDALKRLYRQTQGYNALVELLRQQLERTSADQYEKRLEILREVASVYRQHLKSDTALVSVLNQIVQLDNRLDVQDVVEVRELCALYEKLQRWRDLLTTQQVLAGITEDPEEKKELYRSAARRWLEQFSNVQQATDAYAALIKIAPEDQEAREKLEDLYRRRRAWPALYELFEGELQTSEGARRLQLMQELAQLAAERLNRGADAVRLYKQILDTDPSRGDVLDLLEKYAERAKDWATLGEALEKRVDLLDDPAQRLNVLQKLGSVYADQLKDHHKAASAWRRVLELQPGHPRALRVLRDSYLMGGDYDGLEQLYDAQNDWEGLADVLSNAADRTKESAVRVELSYRAAAVYETRLGQPDRAFRSYERILSTDPSDARAARALIPIYEREEKWIRLPALYEVLYEQTGDDEEKLLLLERLVEVTGKRLNDRKAAAGHARRAYETNPTSETALALMEETARGAGSWESFVEAVEARVATLGEPEARRRGKKRRRDEPEEPSAAPTERRMLELKLAKVYAEELGRIDQAVETYKKLLSREPADGEAVEALEQILRREDRRDDLRWLLALKVEHAAEEERSLILADWAAMEEDVFQAPEKAIDCYRQLLDLDRTHQGALVALPRLLLASGDAEGAVRVIEQHRDQLSDEERAEREVELASLYLTKLNRPEEALEAAIRALDVGTQRSKAVEVLEKLLDNDRVRLRVAEVLASEYASGGDARHEAQALSVILQQTTDDVERLALYTRLADVHEQKLSAHGKALDVVLEALHRYPREIGLWIRAEQLSAQSGRPTDLAEALREALSTKLPPDVEAELSERAARLHEEALGDPIGATPYLEKALELDPGNEVAFTRLKDILTAAERWSDLEALYDRASKAIDDPVRQTEMLVEVALICEEIIEDPKKATLYYERILRADPQHEGAIRALDRLYVKQGRDRDLAELLAKRLEMGLDEDVLELKIRLAKIRLDLLEPDRAIGHVEDVLSRRSNDRDARTLAERMLEIGSLRVRAARILEQVYESRHEIRDLDRMLSIRLEGLDETPEGMSEGERRERDQERLELLRRMAALRDDRLHDDQGALDTLSRLVPADPLDIEARERLLVVGRRVGAHERVAEVLAQASQGADSPAARGEILMRVASIYEDFLGDQAKAEQTYRQVLELDRSDAVLALPAARALERIHLATGQHTKLAEILRVEVRLETDGPARRELLGRLGELCQSVLDDAKGAIEAWRARTDDDPTDELALAALDQLYQRTEQWRELVLIIERRREITDDDQMRKALLMRAAEIYRTRLESVSEAIEAYQALIEQFGPDSESFRALEALFEAAERWDELGETFERHLDIVESDAERLDLLAKVGDLRRERLDDLDGALEAYRRALSVDTAHEPSRLALQKLLESEDPAARREAAFVLHPIYEADGDNDRLLKVIEIEVGASDDPLNRLEGLESAMRVAEGPLNDKRRAYSYARRAVRTALGHTDLEQWLDHLERLAAATGQHADQVQLLSEIVGEIFDGNIQLTVTQRIADLARGQLNDRKLAQEYYQKALELRPDDRRSLRALESLYDEAGDAQSLLGILERRVEAAESDAERKELLFRRARLLSEVVKDKPRAIEVYEAILDLELDPAAIQALEALYREVERWDSLIQLYERQLDAGLGNSPDLHVKIAKVAGQNQGDMLRAFADLEQALEIDRQYAGAVAELERMQESAPEAEQRARAAQLLEPVYLVRSDFDAVMRAIRSRLEFTSDVLERRELRTRLAKMFEEQQEDYASALETIAKLLPDDPSDENTISELERLAKAAGAEKRLAEIYAAELERTPSDDPTTVRLARRTGELFARLVELDRALVFYRRALTVEPDSVPLFEAIDDILKRTERHEDRVQLYRDALEHRFEPAERLRLLHTIASLQRGPLGQPDEAIETYRSLLDVEQSDQRALEALTELYRERKRWDDLAELQLRRAESAERPEEAAEHRLALALLFKTELGDVDRALDQLQEIVNVLPSHPAAIHELEVLREDDQHKQRAVEILRPLYETTDDWKRLLKLNEDRFALAADPSDKVNVLRETARLWEERGRDFSRARRALAEAILIDPDDSGVRSEYERLAELGRAWDQLAETYELVLTEKPDTPSKRDILAVLAKVHDTQRNDPRQALNAYRRLHGVDSAEMEPLEKLEQLSMLLGDWPVLVEVLTTKADLVMSDDERAAAWRQVGEVRRDMLDDSDGAVAAYERAMELDPQDTNILDQVIRLHEDKANADRLVELYQQRVDLIQDGDQDLKYELLVKSADLFEKTLTNSERAIEALRHALEVRPGDSRVLMALNRLYRQEEMWPELLDALRLQATGVEGAEA